MKAGHLFQRVTLEAPRLNLLQPDERLGELRAGSFLPNVGQEDTGEDIHVSVSIDIRGLRRVAAVELGQRMNPEWIAAIVLMPLDAVIGLRNEIIQAVAIAGENVKIAIPVHIDQLDTSRSPVRMRRPENSLLPETPAAIVEKGNNRLMVL